MSEGRKVPHTSWCNSRDGHVTRAPQEGWVTMLGGGTTHGGPQARPHWSRGLCLGCLGGPCSRPEGGDRLVCTQLCLQGTSQTWMTAFQMFRLDHCELFGSAALSHKS